MALLGSFRRLCGAIIDSSILVRFFKKISIMQLSFELKMAEVLKYSQIYKIIDRFFNGIKVAFRNSFLGKITEIGGRPEPDFLGNSGFVKFLSRRCGSFIDTMVRYWLASRIAGFASQLKEKFYLFPVKTGSAVIIVVVLVNSLLSVSTITGLGVSGLLLRVILLFVAYNGLHSQVSLEDLGKTSYLLKMLRFINNPCKIQD